MLAVGAARTVRADKRDQAAEHFALAESAEKRKDWRGAISEYELAYQASPHPWAHFNVAVNYERLGEGRSAASYFRRYLDESKEAKDREEVNARIERLRNRPSRVEITTNPAGAEVFVDGDAHGRAPQTLELAAGSHELHIAHAGRRSAPRPVVVEFGEAINLRIDLDARPGALVVRSNITGAEVRLNGEVVGQTPFSGSFPAGKYQLLVSKPGYRSIQRAVTIPPEGSEQLRADLERIDGKPSTPPESAKWLFGFSYGLQTTGQGMRYLVQLGRRSASNRLELSGLIGTLGSTGALIGGELRVYLTTKRVRPYLRAGVLTGSQSNTGDERITVVEGGAGILVAGKAVTRRRTTGGTPGKRVGFGIDYFLEIAVGTQLQKPVEGESRFTVPIIGGILLRYGG